MSISDMSVQDEILQLASVLCGGQETELALICPAVVQMLQARLRKGVSIDNCHDSFVCAAALTVLSIVKSTDRDSISGFDAGTLKLSFSERTDQIAVLARQLLAPWCGADDFAFCGVRG